MNSQDLFPRRLRPGTACINCRRRKLRCSGTPNCDRCTAHRLDCELDEAMFTKSHGPLAPLTRKNAEPPTTAPFDAESYLHFRYGTDSIQPEQQQLLYENQQQQPYQQQQQQQQHYQQHPLLCVSQDFGSDTNSGSQASANHYRRTLAPSPDKAVSSIANKRPGETQGLAPVASALTAHTPKQRNVHVTAKPTTSSRHVPTESRTKKKTLDSLQSTARTRDDSSPEAISVEDDSANEDVSAMGIVTLDGHGEHYYGGSSGLSVFSNSSRYQQGIYPLPLARLNDSDMWLHSLQATCERELPSRDEMDHFLGLYFRHLYPFSPMFIRTTFMREYQQQRPTLHMIMLLNAIFSAACMYSDDPAVKQDATKYFGRAKIIMDEVCHISSLTNVQTLMLMAHHRHAHGSFSGGWLYSGMAIRMAIDMGLHRQDRKSDDVELSVIKNRVWFALYIYDRVSSAVGGRHPALRDGEFSVMDPSDHWIPEIVGEETDESLFETEKVISCRLLWTVKLSRILGSVLGKMFSIVTETSDSTLAQLSVTEVPQLHNSLTSWFMELPQELAYQAYGPKPSPDRPSSHPTALMHMVYYISLIMVHRPYLRPLRTSTIDVTKLRSSRSICNAAAGNVVHILESLMLHGQLQDSSVFTASCLMSAGMVFLHGINTSAPETRRSSLVGTTKAARAGLELLKTYPATETLLASASDILGAQPDCEQDEEKVPDTQKITDPLAVFAQFPALSLKSIYDDSKMAKSSMEGFEPVPSVRLRHPSLDFCAPLAGSSDKDQEATKGGDAWKAQLAHAIAVAATAFGAPDPRQDSPQTFSQLLGIPETLPLDLPDGIGQLPTEPLQWPARESQEQDYPPPERRSSEIMENDEPETPSSCADLFDKFGTRSVSPCANCDAMSHTRQDLHSPCRTCFEGR
ncbi:unnamed protein product [Mortierella alpina]